MAAQRKAKWYVIAGGVVAVLGALSYIFTMCSQAGLATPLNAASKEDVAAVDERVDGLENKIDRIEGKVDLLLLDRKLRYTPPKEE